MSSSGRSIFQFALVLFLASFFSSPVQASPMYRKVYEQIGTHKLDSVVGFSDTHGYDPKTGKKDIVVFTPGYTMAYTAYESFINRLTDSGYFVLAHDLPGQGSRGLWNNPAARIDNSPCERNCRFTDYVDHVQEVIRKYLPFIAFKESEVGSKPQIILAGHSLGGAISLLTAEKIAPSVKGLFLASPYSGFPLGEFEQIRLEDLGIVSGRLMVKETLERVAGRIRDNPQFHSQTANVDNVAYHVSGRIVIRHCVSVGFSLCSNAVISLPAWAVKKQLKGMTSFDAFHEASLITLPVLLQGEKELDRALSSNSQWAKKIKVSLLAASDMSIDKWHDDKLAPAPMIQSVMDRLVNKEGAQLVSMQWFSKNDVQSMNVSDIIFSPYAHMCIRDKRMLVNGLFDLLSGRKSKVSLASASSNDEIWRAGNVLDGNPNTVYSSAGFGGAANDRNTILVVGLGSENIINTITLSARVWSGKTLGFPKRVEIFAKRAQDSDWTSFGTYSTSSAIALANGGKVKLSLPRGIQLSQIAIKPVELGTDNYGNYFFQIADVEAGRE